MKKKSAVVSVEPGEQKEWCAFTELGKGLVALGNAFQDDKSKISQLSDLATDIGLRIDFRIDDREAKVTSWAEVADGLANEVTELKKQLSAKTHELALIKALTGVHSAVWTGRELRVEHHYGAPFGVPLLTIN